MERILARAEQLNGTSPASQAESPQFSVCQTPRRASSGEVFIQAKNSLLTSPRCAVAFAGLLIVTAVATPAHAQWFARNLNSSFNSVPRSFARGGAGTQVVGSATVVGYDTVQTHAVLWSGSPASGYSFIDLNPTGATVSEAFGTTGTQQVGNATFSNSKHAGLWNGTAASWIDLNPAGATSSAAKGFAGSQQVGQATFGSATHAGLWNGTAASWVNLNPTGATRSEAFGATGTQQVGNATFSNSKHAGLWNGTAASWIDLHPAGATESGAKFIAGTQQAGYAKFGSNDHAGLWSGAAGSWVDLNPAGATSSQINGISGTQQVGQATLGNAIHAGLWNGTADSWVDLNPAGATSSVAYGTFGTTQVGYARFDDGTTWPGVWNGTAASWEPLPFPHYPDSEAGGWQEYAHAESSSVWTDGNYLYAAGYVTRWNYVASNQNAAAVLWSRPISSPLTGDFNRDGVVDGADLENWKAGFFASGTATPTQGDADGDADVDGADFLVWQRGVRGLASAATAHSAVPEPAAAVSLLFGITGLAALVRHRPLAIGGNSRPIRDHHSALPGRTIT